MMDRKMIWHGEKYKRGMRAARTRGLIAIGTVIALRDKLYCPVITGLLRGSITWQISTMGSSTEGPATAKDTVSKPKSEEVVKIGSSVGYDPWVEFKVGKRKSTPHHRPALDDTRNEVIPLFEREYKKEL